MIECDRIWRALPITHRTPPSSLITLANILIENQLWETDFAFAKLRMEKGIIVYQFTLMWFPDDVP